MHEGADGFILFLINQNEEALDSGVEIVAEEGCNALTEITRGRSEAGAVRGCSRYCMLNGIQVMNTAKARTNVQLWPLLFPVSYSLHLAEEYWGGEGFAHWFSRVVGANISEAEFLLINGIAWPLVLLATLLSIREERLGWVTVSLATIVLVNGTVHLLASILTGTYSPGTFTGVFLYIPLGVYGFTHRSAEVVGERLWRAVGIGFFLHVVVAVVAYW